MKKISKIMIAMILLVALVMSSTAATGSLNFFSAPQDGDVATIESGGGQLVAKAVTDRNITAAELTSLGYHFGNSYIAITAKNVEGQTFHPQLNGVKITVVAGTRYPIKILQNASNIGFCLNWFTNNTNSISKIPDGKGIEYSNGQYDICIASTPQKIEDIFVDDSGRAYFIHVTRNSSGDISIPCYISNDGFTTDGGSADIKPVLKTPDYTLVVPTNLKYGDALTLSLSNANHSGAITYKYGTASGNYPNTFTNGSTALDAGTYYFQATTTAGNGYKAHSATATVTIGKANQTLAATQGVWTYGKEVTLGETPVNGNFVPGAKVKEGTTGAAGAITYAIASNQTGYNGIATLNGNKVIVQKVGSVNITATKAGDDNYNAAAIDFGVHINPKDITNVASITTAIANKTYTGAAIVPADGEIALKYNGTTLTKGTDYTVAFADNTNVGTAKCNVTFIGNYSGTQTFNWTISQLDMTGIGVETVGLPTSAVVYTAAEQTPITSVKLNDGTPLVSPTDYSGVYTNNKEVGTATYTVTFKGNYSGTKTFNWTISPFDIANNAENKITIDPITNITYNGAEYKVKPTVKFSGMSLGVSNVDISYPTSSGYFDAGDKTVTITGKGNFSGSTTATYKILPKDISGLNLTSGLPTTAVYTGLQQTPAIGTVTFGGLTVTHNAATYGNNLNVGNATCSIVGNGNYTGTKIFKWTITADTTTSGGAFNNNGKPTTKTISEGVNYADADLGFTVKNGAITYSYKKGDTALAKRPTTPGTYTVTATADDPNYGGEASTATCALTIEDFKVTNVAITGGTGESYTAHFTLTLDKAYTGTVGIMIDGVYHSQTATAAKTFEFDVPTCATDKTYTATSYIGVENFGDTTSDITKTFKKHAKTDIRIHYSEKNFYGFTSGGNYTITDSVTSTITETFSATASAMPINAIFTTPRSVLIVRNAVSTDAAIEFSSEPQTLTLQVVVLENKSLDKNYDGAVYNPTQTLTVDSVTIEPTTYTITYYKKNASNEYELVANDAVKDAGNYRVQYTSKTNEGAFAGIIYSADFIINKIDVTVGTPTITSVTYGAISNTTYTGLIATATHTGLGGSELAGTFATEFTNTVDLSASNHLKAGDYTAKVVFTPTDQVNYNTMTFENIPFTVNKKAITGLTFAKTYDGMADFSFDGKAIANIEKNDNGTADDTTDDVYDDVTLSGTTVKDAAAYADTAVVPGGADKDNYTFEAKTTLTINQAPLTFTKMDATIVKLFDGKTTTGGAQFAKGTHYGVTGLIVGEEGLTDNIKAGDGFAVTFSAPDIADNLTATVTITLPATLSNYTIAEGGTLNGYKAAINGVTVDPSTDYEMTPSTPNGKNSWYNTTVKFVPKGAYTLISEELKNGTSELIVRDRTNTAYTFYLKVSDNGAVAQVKIYDLMIDTVAPTITTAGISQAENKTDGKALGGDATAIANNTKENVKITIPYVEATSGIDHIVVKVGGVEYKFTEFTNNAEAKTLSFVVDKNGTYSVTLVDVAGNESTATDVIVKNIDRTLPKIEVTVNTMAVADANSKKWYGSATVTAVGSTAYAGDITAKAVIKDYDGKVTATETNTATMTIDKNGISTVIVTVTDLLGNVNTMKVVVKVDKNIDTFNAMVSVLDTTKPSGDTEITAWNDKWLTAITTFEKYTAAQKDHIMGKDANDTSITNHAKLMKWKLDHEKEITETLKEKKITELVDVIKTAIGDPDTGTITIDNIDKAIEEVKKATEETKTDPRVKDLIDEVEKLIKLKEELAKIIAPVDPTNPNKNLQVIEPGTYTQLTQIIDVYDKLDPGIEAPTSFIKEILEKLVANTDDIEPITPPYSVKEKIDELKGKKKKIDEFVKEVDKVTPVTPTNFPTDTGSVVTPTVTSIIGQVVPAGGGTDPGTGIVTPITGITIPGIDPGTGTPEPTITIPIELFPEETKDDLEEVIDIKEKVDKIKELIKDLPDPETGIVDPTITIEVKIKEIEELIDDLKKTTDGGDGLIDGGSKKDLEDVKKKVDDVNKDKDDKNKKIDKAIVDILDVLKDIDDKSTPKEILDAKKKFDELDPDVKDKIKTGNLLDTLKPNYFDVDTGTGMLIDNGTDYTDGNEGTTPDVNPDLIENANKVYVETPDPGVDPGTLPLINVIKNIDVTEVTGGKLDELKEIKKKYDDLTKDPVTNDKKTQKKLIDNDKEIKKKLDEIEKLIEKIDEVKRLVGEIPADGSPTCQICLTHDKEYHVIVPDDKSVNGQTEFHKGAIDKAKMAYEKLTGDEKKYIDDVTKKIIDDGYKHLKDYLKDAAREQKVVITDTENNVSVFGIATQVDTSKVDMAADVIDIFMTAEKTDTAIDELSKDLKKVVSYDVKLWAKTNGDENTKKMIQPAAGKSVVVKLPIAADADLTTLRIYHVKGDGSRSLVSPYTISYEGGTTYAVFEVKSFSEFIAYAEKSKNSGGNIDGGGGGMTIDPGDIFWKSTEQEIDKEGETKVIIDIDKVKDKQIPKEIIEKIIDKGKDLVVKEGGKDTTLTNEDLKKLTLTEDKYTLAELLALIEKANKPTVTPTPTPTEKPTEPTEPTAKKCWLCGACPMFLGICLWIWLAIAIVVVAVVVVIVVKKKKKGDDKKDDNKKN